MTDVDVQKTRSEIVTRKKNKQRKPPPSPEATSASVGEPAPRSGTSDGFPPESAVAPVQTVLVDDSSRLDMPKEEAALASPDATPVSPVTPAVEEVPVEPTLCAYFGREAVKIASFVKAVKAADRRRFDHADMAEADELIARNDRDGARLWLLATNAYATPAIEGWVWPFVRNRMVQIVGRDVDFFATSPVEILRMMVARSASSIQHEDRLVQKSSETNLRLGVAWLVEKRGLETLAAAEILKTLFLEKPKDAERRIRRAISQGTRSEMRTAVTALTLADERVRSALGERDEERNQKQTLRELLEAADRNARGQAEAIAGLEARVAELQTAIDDERRRAENADRHAGNDMSQMKADFGVSLRRVRSLVEDAASAVSISMKRADEGSLRGLQAAEKRLQAARAAIDEVGQ